MSSQNEILKMTKDQVNQYLIKNWNDYSKVKNALEHPEIDINYRYTLTRTDKVRPAFKPNNRTPIIHLLENIFKNVFVGLLKDGGVNDDRLNDHLEILKLMLKVSEPWDFEMVYRYNHRYINDHEQELLFSGVRRKTRERFQELMYRGFTIQSLFKDDKLIKELFEIGYEKYNYLDKNWDEDTKKLIKERYKKVKDIIYPYLNQGPKPPPPKPPQKKSFPVWAIILLSVAGFLIVSGGGYYGRKKYLNYKKIP